MLALCKYMGSRDLERGPREIRPPMSIRTSGGRRYTPGMKTAVSIPNDVFKRAERFRRLTNTTRSRLYALALEEYVRRHDSQSEIAALNELLRTQGPPDGMDFWLRLGADTVVKHVKW